MASGRNGSLTPRRFRLPEGDALSTVSFGPVGAPAIVALPGLTDGLAPLYAPGVAAATPRPSPRFNDRRVIVVSYRHHLHDGITTSELAADVASFLETLHAPADVYGHSMGGMVAQHLAAERPDLVSRLVLTATAARARPELTATLIGWEEALRDARWDDFRRGAFAASFPRGGGEQRRLLLRPVAPPPAELVRRHLVLSAAARSHDARPRLGQVIAATLVVAGELDPLAPPAAAEELATAITEAAVEIVAGAGHGLAEQYPDQHVELLAGFLAGPVAV